MGSDTLVLKLVLTPGLIAAASTGPGRRWRQAVGGWLVGLVSFVGFFLALGGLSDRRGLLAACGGEPMPLDRCSVLAENPRTRWLSVLWRWQGGWVRG